MIIKEARIGSFAGIENKVIKFHKGINVIYGENEVGKSRIQSFVKIMLYGISSKRIKGESERKKYMPFNGGLILGELIIENDNREYIIKRVFGNTKKEDSSVILDCLTGEEVENINNNEPGKSFLGINKSTFEKTLYIGQLSVAITKDKEEEIMDKITAIFGCGEHEVPVGKAIEKLENIKKTYVTTRGAGSLDILKKKYSNLLEERYEGYKLSEENLEWEGKLIEEKNKRKKILEQIEKLELYKKYLKKIRLKKEYKEIVEYLKKSEELKKEEAILKSNLERDGDIIDDTFIESLKENNRVYLGLVDKKEEINNELNNCDKKVLEIKEELVKYKFLDLFGDNIKNKLIKLKYEQESIKEKLLSMKSLKESLEKDKDTLNTKKKSLGNKFEYLDENIDSINDTLSRYDFNLRNLKKIAEGYESQEDIRIEIRDEKVKLALALLIIVFGIVLCFLGSPYVYVGIVSLLLTLAFVWKLINSLKNLSLKANYKKDISNIDEDIEMLENTLNKHLEKLQVEDYSKLIALINVYSKFKSYEERMLIRIKEKERIIKEEQYEEKEKKYVKNNEMINSLIKLSKCNTIDEVVESIEIYETLNKRLEEVEERKIDLISRFKQVNKSLMLKEECLRDSLNIMGLDLGNLLDIDLYIKEYKDKIRKKEEVHANLLSMEETYKALLKDRNIGEIKKDLQNVINDNNDYEYESEDDIEKEEKKKSQELLECEKYIKDIENKISTRYIGKRSLPEIEEELDSMASEIKVSENKVKALDIAIDTMKESFDEIRRDIGPALNSNIADIFRILTGDKYIEVKLGENYEMTVRDNLNLFKGNYLSNGASDQLYLALRIALVGLIFQEEEIPIILDDTFVQYDNIRREKALLMINEKVKGQALIFTCHTLEKEIMDKNNLKVNYIEL